MIPRLPPFLLAVLGGASVYGVKYLLDRFEPKAIGPPGSGDHYERVLKYRQNIKRVGMAAAASAVIYGGYWIYESRVHRSSPAITEHQDNEHGFYEDQYREREKRFALEKEEARRKEREREALAKIQLDREITAMEEALRKNHK